MNKIYALFGVLSLGAGLVANATSIIMSEGWASDEAGWASSDQILGAPSGIPTLNWNAGHVEFVLDVGTPAGFIRTSTGASSAFTGNLTTYTDQLSVSFDLLTSGATPSALALYFFSDNGNHWWSYSLAHTAAPLSGTYTYSVPVGIYSAGWIGFNGGTAGTYLSDLAQVNWIGVYIAKSGGDPTATFGVDNFTYSVPEPETVWMILAVVMSMAITFRGQLAKAFTGIKARIVA